MKIMSLLEPTRVAETADGSELLVARNLEEMEQVPGTDEIDQMPALWRRSDGQEWRVDSVRDGRLLLGLWRARGPFDIVPEGAVPVEVATSSNAHLAAYLYLQLDGHPDEQVEMDRGRTRNTVADLLGLEHKRSVTNYFADIRVGWSEI